MKIAPKRYVACAISAALLLSFIASADAASAGNVRDLWFHQVPRIRTAPTIDGKTDDACWKTLPALSNFGRDRFSLKSKVPIIPMSIRLGFDDTYLYGLWHIGNLEGEHRVDYRELKKKQEERMHDMAMYWNHPSVEFRIDGRRDRLGETAIQMNLIGQKQAMQLIATGWSREYSDGWDIWADYQYEPGHNESGWWLELKVSLKDMGAEARPGTILGAQFRYFHPGAYFAWTPGGYSVAAYGDLLLVEEPIATEEALKLVCPDYRSVIIRMPQPDKVIVVEKGRFSEIPYRDTVMQEVSAVKRRRTETFGRAAGQEGLDGAKLLAEVDKQIEALDKDLGQIEEFRAHDLMRLRQPLDSLHFALKEAEASVKIKELLKGAK